MFESAELAHAVTKIAYRREEPKLRAKLLDAQYDLKQNASFATLILIAGVEGAGKGQTIHQLNGWMDPRFVLTNGFAEPSDEERERPQQWRYWKALPPKGSAGVFFGAWHTEPILARVAGELGAGGFARKIDEIVRLEKMLAEEGLLLLKYWFHVSKKVQKKNLAQLGEKPPPHYRRLLKVSEEFVRRTSSAEAPWIVVPAAEKRFRALTFGRHLLAALRERLDEKPVKRPADKQPPLAAPADRLNVLRALKLDQPMGRADYRKQLEKLQQRLNELSRDKRMRKLSVVAAFEGNDAAGKGGAIRRLRSALNPVHMGVYPVGAPTDEESARPFLWRFWRHVPLRGHTAIYDRSWYGRVLVERVEGFAAPGEWQRAYGEINDFEAQLTSAGYVVHKFWLAIDPDEQLRRFEARKGTPHKRFKITEEDWRNREKWPLYAAAVEDMISLTSTEAEPWTLVESNSKRFSRVKILRTLADRLETEL